MSNDTRSTDDIYDDNSEASRAKGYRPKGTQPRSAPPVKAGKIKVINTRPKLGLSMLAKYQLLVLTTNTFAGLFFIADFVADPSLQAHMMWAYGIANVVAMVPCFFKRE